MWIVRVARQRPYTFIVLALLLPLVGPTLITIFGSPMRPGMPTDIFPDIEIPVAAVIFNYSGLPPDEMAGRIVANVERSLTTIVNDVEHLIIALIVVGVVGWGLYSRYRASTTLRERTEAQIAMPVAVILPSQLQTNAVLSLPGEVRANTEASIYARASGYLKSWHVDIGAAVEAGQVLAEIDAPEIDQQLLQAKADLANAEAANRIAQSTADRWRGLRASDSVSPQDADEKISSAEASGASVEAARANLQRLQELASFERVTAPFDGIVTARNTDIGQRVTAGGGGGEPLFRLEDTRRLRVYVRVPQTYAAIVSPGLHAQLHFPDRPGRPQLRCDIEAHVQRAGAQLPHAARRAGSGQQRPGAAARLLRAGDLESVRLSLQAELATQYFPCVAPMPVSNCWYARPRPMHVPCNSHAIATRAASPLRRMSIRPKCNSPSPTRSWQAPVCSARSWSMRWRSCSANRRRRLHWALPP